VVEKGERWVMSGGERGEMGDEWRREGEMGDEWWREGRDG
jgi:hypothetical protein